MKKVVLADHRLLAAKYMKKQKGFKFISLLGTGSYGTVIQMENKQLGMVAVKIVNRRVENRVESTEWKSLDHPNVLRLIMMDDYLPSCVIFVTDLMRTNLTRQLNEKSHQQDPRAIAKNKRYLREVLHGLSYIHSRNLCHLDLRADNVFVAYDGRAVIADFSGLCLSEEKKNFCPLPKCFRPPEMFKGNKKNKVMPKPIDLWAFGLLVIHMFYLKKFCKVIVKQEVNDSSNIVNNLRDFIDPLNIKFALSKYYPASPVANDLAVELSDFVSRFLKVKPHKRCNADDGLVHPFLVRDDTQIYIQVSHNGPSIAHSSSASPCSDESKTITRDIIHNNAQRNVPETSSDGDIVKALNPELYEEDRAQSCNSKRELLDHGNTARISRHSSGEMDDDEYSTILLKGPVARKRNRTNDDTNSSEVDSGLRLQRLKTSMCSEHEDPDTRLIQDTTLCERESKEFLVNYEEEAGNKRTESSGGTSEDGPSDIRSKWIKFRWKFNHMKRWKVK